MVHYARVLLDEVFGPDGFQNEIVWKRTTAHSSAERYAPVHDTLLYYTKTPECVWNKPRAEYDQAYLDKYYRFDDGDGRLYWRDNLCADGVRKGSSGKPWRGIDPSAKGMHWKFTIERLDQLDKEGRIYFPPKGTMPQYKRYRDELKGKAVSDIWDDIDRINPVGSERTGYPTQKPLGILRRIVRTSSPPGGLVADYFAGSGTTGVAAHEASRRFLLVDESADALQVMRRRFAGIEGVAFS